MPLFGARAGPGVCVPRSSHFISRNVVRQQWGSGSNTSSSSSSIRGHYKMSSLTSDRTDKERLLLQSNTEHLSSSEYINQRQFPSLIMVTLDKAALGLMR